MTTAIVKFNKTTLAKVAQKDLFLENAWGLTIKQFSDVTLSNTYSLPFEISIAEIHAPYIEEDMVVVIREKVDLTATGPNDVLIKNIGKDLGGENYVDKKPYRPKELPPGFEEALQL
jgi:hypothetical protein